MSAEFLFAQPKISPLSTFRELLRWSKNVVAVAPLVGSQLQALFIIAETIVDIVERVHRDREAEIDLAKKVCETVTIVACALVDCSASDTSGLLADLSEVYHVAETIQKVVILRSKRTLRNRFFLASTKVDDVTKLSNQLDEVVAMFQFKCAIQMRIGIQKLSQKLDTAMNSRAQLSSAWRQYPSTVLDEGPSERLSSGKRPRSPNSNVRSNRRRQRLDKPTSMIEENREAQNCMVIDPDMIGKKNEHRTRSRGRERGIKPSTAGQKDSEVRGRSSSQNNITQCLLGEGYIHTEQRARSLSPEVRARVTDGARRKAMYMNNWTLTSPMDSDAGHYSLCAQA